MHIHTLLLYIVASILLSIILQYLSKKKNGNILDAIIISNIYILFLSGLFSTLHLTENNNNIFLIILFQILGSIFYMNFIKEASIWKNEPILKQYLLTLVSSYLLNILVINQIKTIFPTETEVKIILWLLIIIYLYQFLKENSTWKIPQNKEILFYQDKEYIVMQYAKYKNRYSSVIHSKYQDLIPLIYAMMIYENYSRPEFIRNLDRLKYKILEKPNKFGIMQIYRNKEISDEESIQIAIKKLEKIYQTLLKNKRRSNDLTSNLIYHYYHKKMNSIQNIYQIIIQFNKN